MKFVLKYLRQKPEFYSNLKKIYGATLGFYWFKELYLRKIGLWNGKKRIKLISDLEANNIVTDKIRSKEPFMLARYGSNEFRNLFQENEFDTLCFNAGFFPNEKKLLEKFRKVYFEASKQIDYLCVWNYLQQFNKKRKLIRNLPNITSLFSLGPSGLNSSWIKSLEGKNVLVIHPFKKTIEMQHKKRKRLKILPEFKKLEVIGAVQTIAGQRDRRFKTWFEALDFMKEEIDKKDFDIALIGCGAYGLPLAAHVKLLGKQAIHAGGGLQLFFGILGRRWNKNQLVRVNRYWTKPLKGDLPARYKEIEGGCYW